MLAAEQVLATLVQSYPAISWRDHLTHRDYEGRCDRPSPNATDKQSFREEAANGRVGSLAAITLITSVG